MFLDEARVASRIRHPNVVSILDVVAETGELFIVMEYVQGEALSKLLRASAGPVPLPIAIAIAAGMLEGLHAAHEARGEDGEPLRIVHRDVSPQNVLVGVDGVARLIDFGVAKAAGNSRVTREGQIKGKIAYMAPEQIRAQPVDGRADVYAASVVLWETLTRRRFLAESDNDAASVLMALEGRFDPPSKHRPDVPEELDRIAFRGLSARAADRFASARQMAQALERIIAPAPAREVGEWVLRCSGEELGARAERVRSIESASEVTALPRSGPVESTAPEPELAGVSPSAGAASLSPRRRTWTTLAVSAALVVAAAMGFLVSRAVQSAPTEAAPLASEPAPASPAPPATPQSEPEPPTAASLEPPPPPTPSAAPPRAGAPPVTRVVRPKSDCNPPYVVTADGVRRYKPECVR